MMKSFDAEVVSITHKHVEAKKSSTFVPNDNIAMPAARARALGVQPASGYHRVNRHEKMQTCLGQCANRVCTRCTYKCNQCNTRLCARCVYFEEGVLHVDEWQPTLERALCLQCVHATQAAHVAAWVNSCALPDACYPSSQQFVASWPVQKNPSARSLKF